jgi:preprotein translocase subunit SecA
MVSVLALPEGKGHGYVMPTLTPRKPEPLHKGADAFVNSLIGRWRRRRTLAKDLEAEAHLTDNLAPAQRDLATRALQVRLEEMRDLVRRGRLREPEVAREALALVREAARRTVGLEAFPVQLMGALAMQRGWLAEMATGEGKTLTAGLTAVLFGWTGQPCHVVTVNDYLVERDAQFLRPLLEMCGLRAGHVTGNMKPEDRPSQYAAHVVWGTSKEFAADFLRDQLQGGPVRDEGRLLVRELLRRGRPLPGGVQRGLHTAIVDEADSLLIDEAVTPLIISRKVENAPLTAAIQEASRMAERFVRGEHYQVRDRHREIEFNGAGDRLLEECGADLTGLWRAPGRCRELLRLAISAREFYHRGQQYVVENDKVVIVDEFTGRPMVDRSWRQGLHQAVEAREQVPVTPPSDTVARISFQKFFRLYRRICGMTGTAREASPEFWHVYGLAVMPVPTNRPCIRTQKEPRCFATHAEKLEALVQRVKDIHATGAPVLAGTRSVRASEELAGRLEAEGMMPHVLNATRIREEAMIVAAAGEPRRITIATNMAGRGTDIRLSPGIAALGGLHVISAERSESGRVDRQLYGRCARQGDPGHAESFASAEDEILRRFTAAPVRAALSSALSRGVPGAQSLAERVFRKAQRTAQREAFRQRRRILQSDDWLESSLAFAETGGF